MADVAVIVKVMPEGSEVDLDRVAELVKARVDVHKIEKEPIAFGLEALVVTAVVPDAAGGTDKLEETLAGIEGVGNVYVTGMTRLL